MNLYNFKDNILRKGTRMGNKTCKVEITISTAVPKIQDQPNEILELIFMQLPRLTELLNCSNTCIRWKKIVEDMYKDRGILINI